MKFRSLPTGGNPIPLLPILKAVTCNGPADQFFRRLVPGKHIYPVSSGSAALRLALDAVKLHSNRNQIILPAYTCPSILAAIVNSGLEPVLCDLAPSSFNLDLSDLRHKIGRKTLAIIVVHLFGLPEKINLIKQTADAFQVFVIEDASQALGTKLNRDNEITTGEIGDLAIFSFGRGKPFSLLSGGIVSVNNSKFAEPMNRIYSDLLDTKLLCDEIIYFIKLLAYTLLFHPRFFWIPESIPFLDIGKTIFSLKCDLYRMSTLAKNLGFSMRNEIAYIIANRHNLSNIYNTELQDIKVCFSFFPEYDHSIRLLRFPLIFKHGWQRDKCLSEMKLAGLGASGSYPLPLNRIADACRYVDANEQLPNSQETARRILTLPLHQHVRERDIKEMKKILFSELINS